MIETMMFIENFSVTWTPNVSFLSANSEVSHCTNGRK